MNYETIVRAVNEALGRAPDESAPLMLNDATVDIIAREFSRHFGVVVQGGKLWVLDKYPLEDESAPLYKLMKPDALVGLFAPHTLYIPKAQHCPTWAQAWLSHAKRDTFNGLTVDPARPTGRGSDGIWNAWPGMRFADITAASPTPDGSCEIIKQHLLEVWGCGSQALFEYIWNLWARMIQQPGERQDVMPILQSNKQGAGKDLPLYLLSALFPPQGVARIQSIDQLLGRFNKYALTKPVLHAEDILFAPSKRDAAKLRGLITGETLTVEEKNEPLITLHNHLHPWVTTNAAHAANVPRSDRRQPVLAVSEARVGDRPYFANMEAELLSNGERGLRRLRWELMSVKLNGFHPQDIPTTAAREANMIASEPPEISWWRDVLDRGELWNGASHVNGIPLSAEQPTEVLLPQLLDDFRHFTELHVDRPQRTAYDNHKFATTVLGTLLGDVLPQPEGYPKRLRRPVRHLTGMGVVRSPNGANARVSIYLIPPLDGRGGARERFAAEHGGVRKAGKKGRKSGQPGQPGHV